jgi:ubiquinone/menaquinone biosynthesis C-methylase UbiE
MHRYNQTADMYDGRYCAEQEAKYQAALETANIRGDSVVLDLGCGTGLLFNHIANKVAYVVGVDVSKQLLLQAQQRTKPHPNAAVVLADADHLPFKAETFSHLFAFTVLQNMPKPLQTLTETKRVTKSDGRFVLTALKRAISLEAFGTLLEQANLVAVELRDDDALQCHVVTAIRCQT